MSDVSPALFTQYATFEVSRHYLGIRVLEVQEVLKQQRVTRVPLAPPEIAGLINVRGRIIPALEMRRLLQIESRSDGQAGLSVVLQTGAGPVSLQVDEIGDVVEIEAARVEAPPVNLDAHIKRYLSGVCQLNERLLLVLHIDRTVDVSAAYGQSGAGTNETTERTAFICL